ncbi:hypothetical protein [Phenylobacterium sp.]|jgi:hypothetical protein
MLAWVVIVAHTAFLVGWPVAETSIRNHRLKQARAMSQVPESGEAYVRAA